MTFWEFTISFLGEEGHTVFMRPFLKLFNYLIILYCKRYLLQEKIFKKDIFLKSLHSVVASYVPFVIFEFGIFFHLYAISTNNRTLSLVSLPINLIIPEKNQPSKSTDKSNTLQSDQRLSLKSYILLIGDESSTASYPVVSLSMCAQRKAGRRQSPTVYTLPMVPRGSSPVTRVSRSPLPCEKRSAWGGG